MQPYHLYILNPYNLVYLSCQNCASKAMQKRILGWSESFAKLKKESASVLMKDRCGA
jgi:hypothetical protein